MVLALTKLLRTDHAQHSVTTIATNVAVRAAIVAGVVWIMLRAAGQSIRDLGFERDSTGQSLVRWVLLAAGLFVAGNVVLNNIFYAVLGRGESPPIAELFRDPHDAPFWVFSAIVGGGFAEELWRAFVLTRFDALFGRKGLVFAVIADSLVFGLGHLYQGSASALTTVFTGALLALIFLWKRRVIDAMVVHALFDLAGIAVAYALYLR